MLAGVGVIAVPHETGGGHDASALFGDERGAFSHPAVDDELTGLPLELTHQGLHRHRHTGHHGRDVRVHQNGDLFAVTTQERPNQG